jgi:hypothetical protein
VDPLQRVERWMESDEGMWTVLRRSFGTNAVTYASSLDLWFCMNHRGQLLAFERGGRYEVVSS